MKIGRTHLQDATPIRLGQEFRGYASQVEARSTGDCTALAELLAVPIGGTAVGTGINAHEQFAARWCARADPDADRGSLPRGAEPLRGPGAKDAIVEAYGALRTIAVSLSKIAERHPAARQRAALRHRRALVPATQPGSTSCPAR